jgi:hypothetical protein
MTQETARRKKIVPKRPSIIREEVSSCTRREFLGRNRPALTMVNIEAVMTALAENITPTWRLRKAFTTVASVKQDK